MSVAPSTEDLRLYIIILGCVFAGVASIFGFLVRIQISRGFTSLDGMKESQARIEARIYGIQQEQAVDKAILGRHEQEDERRFSELNQRLATNDSRFDRLVQRLTPGLPGAL